MQVDGVEDRAPHVVLHLLEGRIADADGPRAFVTGEVVDRPLHELVLAADAVHDLQVLLARGHGGHEVEEVVRLAREAERVETPQPEGAVADPGVAVVPVALAADRLGQRGGGRCEQRARRAVRQPLQRQSAALEKALPWVLRKLAAVDPLPPVIRRPLHTLERLLSGRRSRMLGPVLLARRVAAEAASPPPPRPPPPPRRRVARWA